VDNEFKNYSRAGYRAKRKKTNLVLNGLIVIVLLLIIFVAYTIFAGGSDKAAPKKNEPTASENAAKSPAKDNSSKEGKTSGNTTGSDQQTGNSDQQTGSDDQQTNSDDQQNSGDDQQSGDTETTTPDKADSSQAVETAGGSTSDVQKTIENPAWKPVGTSQTGSHTPTYDTNSVDWQEMLNAISYATGLQQSNMIVHFLGRDRSQTNASIGTVYSKDKSEKYRVYLKWVDGGGWQPTKVEELSSVQ
jgi:cytoskeletal protein RodZ